MSWHLRELARHPVLPSRRVQGGFRIESCGTYHGNVKGPCLHFRVNFTPRVSRSFSVIRSHHDPVSSLHVSPIHPFIHSFIPPTHPAPTHPRPTHHPLTRPPALVGKQTSGLVTGSHRILHRDVGRRRTLRARGDTGRRAGCSWGAREPAAGSFVYLLPQQKPQVFFISFLQWSI